VEKITRKNVKKGDIVWNSAIGKSGIFIKFIKGAFCVIRDTTGESKVNINFTWLSDKTKKEKFMKNPKNVELLEQITGKDFEEEEEEDEEEGKTQKEKKEKNNIKAMPGTIKDLFIKLTKSTMPGGHEDLVEQYLPAGWKKDNHGNYYIKIGDSSVMFTSHVDTADYGQPKEVTHVMKGDMIETDGKTILGADDKAGTAVMIYMIEKKIPGLYYFFLGEEHGCVGSRALNTYLNSHRDDELFKKIDKVIALDRRDYDSVITSQVGDRCCSDEFAEELAKRLNAAGAGFKYRKDPTGLVTDSHQVATKFPECTNLSVGYDAQHSHQEKQNIVFLQKFADVCCKIDWETLPVKRDPTKVESTYNYGRRTRYYDDDWSDQRWWEGGVGAPKATSLGPGSLPANAEYVTDYLGNDIRVADAQWCEYDKAWCPKDDAIWVDYIGFYTTPDFDPAKVVKKRPINAGGMTPLTLEDLKKGVKIYGKDGDLFGTVLDIDDKFVTISTQGQSKFITKPDKILIYGFQIKAEKGGNKLTEKDLKEGLLVIHPQFGEGKIIGIRNDKMIVKVMFKEKGEKDLRVDVASMSF
jgi:hypothetical protein